jgi:hypothetical protein
MFSELSGCENATGTPFRPTGNARVQRTFPASVDASTPAFFNPILRERIPESESIAQNYPLKSRIADRSNHVILSLKAIQHGPEK